MMVIHLCYYVSQCATYVFCGVKFRESLDGMKDDLLKWCI